MDSEKDAGIVINTDFPLDPWIYFVPLKINNDRYAPLVIAQPKIIRVNVLISVSAWLWIYTVPIAKQAGIYRSKLIIAIFLIGIIGCICYKAAMATNSSSMQMCNLQ